MTFLQWDLQELWHCSCLWFLLDEKQLRRWHAVWRCSLFIW